MSRWSRSLPAVLLVGAAGFSLLGHATFFNDPTHPNDWKRAAEFVSQQLPADTWIRVEPVWSDAPLVHLTQHRDRVDRRRVLLPEDQFKQAGAWVIAEAGRADDAVQNAGGILGDVHDFGSVRVVEVAYPSRYSWSARTNLQEARIERVTGNATEHCGTWSPTERRWDCGRRDKWVYVRDMVKEVGDEPRDCIFMHPIPGKVVRASLQVPAGKNLRVRAGIDLRSARSARGTDVRFKVTAPNATRELTIAHNSQDWHALDLPLGPTPQTVSFEVTSDKVFDRYFCWDAFVEP